jgi:Domain of unknown function (DUF3850)
MPLQIIKTSAEAFEEIQSGRRTAAIVKNDRTWSTYDEIFFVECDNESTPTGNFVRMAVNSTQFGEIFGLAPAHGLLFLRATDKQPQPLPIEKASRAALESALKENEATVRSPQGVKQGVLF